MDSQSSSSSTTLPSPPGPGSTPDSEGPGPVTLRNPHTGTMISKIEDILKDMLDALKENRVLAIPLRSRRSGNWRTVRFPATTEAEVKRFSRCIMSSLSCHRVIKTTTSLFDFPFSFAACLLQILHLAHECLVSGTIITKRNIYYQNPELFGSQAYVDTLVDDIAFTFGAGRDALNIVAACKGLLSGVMNISMKDGSGQNCGLDPNGTLIPDARTIENIDAPLVKWVLIVEKEATFRGLVASRYFESSRAGPGVIITGKGYPDLATRQLLNLLHAAFPRLPFYALVDFDPDGLAIMRTYKCGSLALNHEENITLPSLSWLGPKSHDILSRSSYVYSGNSSQNITPNHDSPPNLLEVSSVLTVMDRKKGVRLLGKLVAELDQDGSEEDLVCELQIMLILNIKAEIQAIDEAGDMTGWLDNKLSSDLS
ncbi:Spo11/DNA topoisomerase VI subunit A [Biscogniauxia sp. FL1348]|nr:Spo11/DNA topoisomerase VI subunit A [Biscogniauxia sp. FL1348]